MKSRFIWLAIEDEALLVQAEAFLVLDLGLHVVDCVDLDVARVGVLQHGIERV